MGATYEENETKNPRIEEIPLPVVVFSSQEPIVSQPVLTSSNGWMPKPDPVADCPTGLEYLAALDEVHVHHQQSHEFKYCVTNKRAEKIYLVQLTSSAKHFVSMQKFAVTIFDNHDKEVISIDHKFGGNSCFCCCFLQKIHAVSSSSGTELGTLEQEWNILYPTFAVRNDNGIVLRIEGPCTQSECCSDIDFKIITPDGSKELGRISKKLDPSAPQNSSFGVCFPPDMDVRVKALLLSSSFLIDLAYLKTAPQ